MVDGTAHPVCRSREYAKLPRPRVVTATPQVATAADVRRYHQTYRGYSEGVVNGRLARADVPLQHRERRRGVQGADLPGLAPADDDAAVASPGPLHLIRIAVARLKGAPVKVVQPPARQHGVVPRSCVGAMAARAWLWRQRS